VSVPPAPPPKYRLATWLSAGILLIVLAALTMMAVASSVVVSQFASRQALARGELAASSAREYFRRLGESNLIAARTLAGNPTLARLLDFPASPALSLFLRNYCESVRATTCLVRQADTIVATSAPVPAWSEISAARAEQGERFALGPRSGGPPLLGALVPVATHPGFEVLMLQSLAGATLSEAGRQSGALIDVQNLATYRAPDDDPLTPLHAAALTNGVHAAARVSALDGYAASVVLINGTGEPVALLDARLPAQEFDRSAAAYRHVVILVSVLVAALAGLAGLVSGRRVAAPVVRLAEMARRIGQGDFSPAVPTVVPRELDSLAHAMDEMRQNLIELTARLRSREAEAQAVLSGVVEGVFVTDEQRLIVYANPQFTRSAPGAAGGAVGKFCGDVLHPHLSSAERPCERDCPIMAARQGRPARSAEQLKGADGLLRATIVVSAPPAEGRQVQLLRDETELEAVRRARDGVLGNISHEFRTPLAAQLAAIEMLRDGIDTIDAIGQRALLANVERGVLRLMRLIDNLLESVRIESGQLELRRQQVSLEATAREATELMRPLLAQSELGIAQDFSALHGESVPGDAQRLQQVYVNLLSNAAKFAPRGSTIRIGASRIGERVESWVDDAGPGIPPGDPGAIFERFRRGENAEPDAPGLGLGLWIVRSIIERHDGTIRVERTTDAHTRFVLNLPAGASA